MTKTQFKKIAYELGYSCKYSGHSRTFYLKEMEVDNDVPGDEEFKHMLSMELMTSGFNTLYV